MTTECDDPILQFEGEYHFLSNFHPGSLMWEGLLYPTSEHAYQAAKTTDKEIRLAITKLGTPGAAKKFGKTVPLREDWNSIKNDIMYSIVTQKFIQNAELREQLLATGNRHLVEGNWWRDTYWGVCNEVGQNHLGKILMRVRSELREQYG